MRPRAVLMHWLIQSIAFAFGVFGVATTVMAQATAPTVLSLNADSMIGILSTVIGSLVAKWSWNQEKRIERAQATADSAVAIASEAKHKVEVDIAVRRAVERVSGEHRIVRGDGS